MADEHEEIVRVKLIANLSFFLSVKTSDCESDDKLEGGCQS